MAGSGEYYISRGDLERAARTAQKLLIGMEKAGKIKPTPPPATAPKRTYMNDTGGESLDTIAEAEGISRKAVQQNQHRALAKARRYFEQRGVDIDDLI